MSVSSFYLVNSAITLQYELMIKMSIAVAIILTAIMITVFHCFQMSL